MEKTASIETNLDDLIVALTDETAPFVQSKEKLYRTVAFMLTRLLNAAPCRQQPRQTAPNLLDQTRDSVRVIEKQNILDALTLHRGNVTHTAKALGVSRATLQNKMKQYGLRQQPS